FAGATQSRGPSPRGSRASRETEKRAPLAPSRTTLTLIRGAPAERGLVAADRIEKFFAVELELYCADAVYGCYLLQRHRLTVRHFEEAAVRQNHIGWDRLRLGKRRAARTGRVE